METNLLVGLFTI